MTAALAALVNDEPNAITVPLAHMPFNLAGIALVWPPPGFEISP